MYCAGVSIVPAGNAASQHSPVDDWSRTFTTVPLGFPTPGEMRGYDEYLVRVMTANDPDSGAIRIPAEVATGTPVWIMRRDAEKMAVGVEKLASELGELTKGESPKFVFHFDCAGRGNLVLREQQKTNFLKCLQGSWDKDVPWIGFYTFGELAPVGERNCFHNWTAVVAAIY